MPAIPRAGALSASRSLRSWTSQDYSLALCLVLWNYYFYIPQEKVTLVFAESLWDLLWRWFDGIDYYCKKQTVGLCPWGSKQCSQHRMRRWAWNIHFLVSSNDFHYCGSANVLSIHSENHSVWWLLNKALKLVLHAQIDWIIFWVGIALTIQVEACSIICLLRASYQTEEDSKFVSKFIQSDSRFDNAKWIEFCLVLLYYLKTCKA